MEEKLDLKALLNPNTFNNEPFYIFTDDAMIPPTHDNGPANPPPGEAEKTSAPPEDEPRKS